ncbi:MAG: hypothetical protein AB7Y46_08240 [Armatimonadota bacterium]
MARAAASRLAAWLAVVVAIALLSGGCPRRQEIAQQTISARVHNVTGEAENSAVRPELLTWAEVGRFDTGFTEARGVACAADGRIYVAGDRAVRCFTSDGTLQWEMPLNGPAGPLAFAPDGSLLVGLRQRVEQRALDGSLVQTWTPYGERTWITSIAAGRSEVYLADAGNRTVWRFDYAAQFLSEIGREDPARGIPGLSVPSPHLDLALAPNDTLVLTNPGRRSVQVHSVPDGALRASWGRSSNAIDGFGGCCNPTDIALLPDGRVVTSEKGLPRVKVHSADGALLSVVAPPADFDRLAEGIDLAVDGLGRVIVLDPARGQVRLYEERAPAAPARVPQTKSVQAEEGGT